MPKSRDFESAYLRYSDKIYRFLYWHTKDTYLAEDLTSEVFARAWQHWDKFEDRHLQAWLYRIAGNLLTDSYRRKKAQSLEGMELPYDAELFEALERDEELTKLSKALEDLNDNLRTIVILRFMEGYSAKEVGQMLDLSEVNVRVLQHRALGKLREALRNG
jgi:RNA polymerase sigma-70 factor (ECF subfamily)